MDGQAIFFLLSFVVFITGTLGADRVRRQYSLDEIDPVSGAHLATCTFYGDNTVDCNGRLRCHPRDVADRILASELSRVCPNEPSQRSGIWDRDQVIPSSVIRGTGSGRLAQCKFYASHQQGKFTCIGAQGDTWKGEYTGTVNTAFKLGLPLTGYGSASPYANEYPSRGRTADDDYNYRPTTSYYGGRDDYRFTTPRSAYDRDNYDGGRYSTGLGYGDRDPNYRDNIATGRDRFDNDYRGRNTDNNYNSDRDSTSGTTESEITMCTYTSDGNGVCRDCTERADRRETDREIRTTRHYTCRGRETPASWSASSGLIPGKEPSRWGRKTHVATCIYRSNPKRFECHGGSADGGCSMSSDGSSSSSYGNGLGSSAQKCLTGEKWTGTYSGSIYNN